MDLKLEEKWMLIVEDLTEEENIPDLEEFKHLIFDTFQYLESVHSENANYQKDLLLLYKYIIQTNRSRKTQEKSCWLKSLGCLTVQNSI